MRDRYVNVCNTLSVPPRRDLMSRFMEVQALLLSVFCPHTAEKIWADLGHTTSILKARFPAVKHVNNEDLLAQNDYVQELMHAARERLAKFTRATTTGAPASVSKPVIVVYVAKMQPPWQRKATDILHRAYLAAGGTLQADSLGTYFKEHADLQPHMKALMAFASELREDTDRRGEDAFLLTGASFAEDDLIRRLAEYIRRALQVQEVRVLQHGEGAENNDAKSLRAPRPGKPNLKFL